MTMVLAVVLGGACKRQPPAPQERIVARVGDSVITARQLDEQISMLPAQERARVAASTSVDDKRKVLDEMVRIEAAAVEARRRGYDRDPQLVRMMRQQLVAKLLREEVDAKATAANVPDAEVQRYYAEHADEFRRPQESRVSQVFVKDETKAKKVAAEARANAKDAVARQKAFQSLVARHSEDEPSKLKGGDLGFLDPKTRAHAGDVVAAALSLKEIGDTSEPIKSDKGFHVLQLTQIRPAVVRSLADMKPLIQQRLLRTIRTQKTDALMAEVRKNVKVEIDEQAVRELTVGGTQAGPKPASK